MQKRHDSKTTYWRTGVALKRHEVFAFPYTKCCKKLVKRSNRVNADLDWVVDTASKTKLASEGPDF